MNYEHTISVLFDGIKNSVFESQVQEPLVKKLDKNKHLYATLISFERTIIPAQTITTIIPHHDRLRLIQLKRLPFLGSTALRFETQQLKKVLKKFDSYTLLARGPLAGYVCLQAIKNNQEKTALTIQARGLAAEEYRYTQNHKKDRSQIRQFIDTIRYNSLKQLEQTVFSCKPQKNIEVTIEAVSPALKEYLIKTFNADHQVITIAQHDLPEQPKKKVLLEWRNKVRTKLGIQPDTTVYCYSGSDKAWQCINEMIKLFRKKLDENDKSIFLIMTRDKKSFLEKLRAANIREENYKIISVEPSELIKHLAAADYGLLLREKDSVNWVARPTKMLEYQAAGLKIIHNQTVEALMRKE